MNPTNLFDSFNPAEAWLPWEATTEDPWDIAKAAHLFRRAGFGTSASALATAARSELSTELDRLFDRSLLESGSFTVDSNQLNESALASGDPRNLSLWWLHAMLNSPLPLLEKTTLFWHGHFATGAEKVKEAQLMMAQNRMLRFNALGSFSKMVHEISKDPAMLIYLDSAANRKAHPNENYARELMELFCLGEGNYTEHDVRELARCFTGWEVRRSQFRFNVYQHDSGTKQVLDRQSLQSGEEAVDAVLASRHAPIFIIRKLFRFFVADEPAPPDILLAPLAKQLVDQDWQIAGVVRQMLGSRLMFSAAVRGRKIRSPIDWALNWMKAFEITTNLKKISDALHELGQAVFYPPNVKGWDGGRAWINSSTLVGRTNLISQMLRDETTRFAGEDLTRYFRDFRVRNAADLVQWCEENLLPVRLRIAARQKLLAAMESTGGIKRIADCLILAGSIPEMQMS